MYPPQAMAVRVEVYSILGQKVTMLIDRRQQAGTHNITWDAGRMVSGTYLYRIAAEADGVQRFVSERQMVLIK